MTVITENIALAAEFIRGGGVVAFPTETVYGLGANAFDPEAVAKIFAAKGRPADNPLIVHIGSEDFEGLAESLNANAEKLIAKFFPGPLTVVLKKAKGVPDIVTTGLRTVAVRMPANELARRFISACGVPLAAPSANISGRPSPTTWQAVEEDLGGRIDCILKGEPTAIGLESTVVDCTGEFPVVLRSGAVTFEMLRRIVPETKEFVSGSELELRSPGLRHKHYSPDAAVRLIDKNSKAENASEAAFIGLEAREETFRLEKVCKNVEEYAASLFEFFRECDRAGINTIFCEKVKEEGIGVALMDRIRRAGS